jgi:hypothetical protein
MVSIVTMQNGCSRLAESCETGGPQRNMGVIEQHRGDLGKNYFGTHE